MKKFIFSNGQTRLESQLREGRSFKSSCILWGCLDKETKEPLPYTTQEATEKEIQAEEERLAEIQQEYEDLKENERGIMYSETYKCHMTHRRMNPDGTRYRG